ncbi:MAG: glycosyltransferase family 39 protein [Chloroflexota bacterium]|nr:glycosyltransferase family 39 protein [Chloroflexota bacterium]
MAKPQSLIPGFKGYFSFLTSHLSFLILAFLLRLAPLGRYVTPDEPAWVYRAIRFSDALAAHDWAAIPSTGHPGVTTMWLGAAGVTVQRLLDPSGSAAHLAWIRHLAWLSPENGEAFRHLAVFLPWGRVAVAVVTTLGLAILYPLLARMFDRRVALLTVGLLACDPFLAGHSGLLHTDALLATFSLLALATALNGLREPRRATWWALSGLFTGLALLTKTPAVILLPFILLLITIAALTRHSPFAIRHSLFAIRHSLLFVASLLIILFALYPALWADPAGTFQTLFAFAGRHVETVQRPIFFAGQTTYDPGLAFYPVVLLFRISPIVLVGLVAGLISLRRLPPDCRFTFLLLLTFAIGFGALMSLGVKKHDRYLLPALPPLTLAAALGWRHLKHTAHIPILPHLLLLTQLILALIFAPYPLTAFNPLAGGPRIAARVLSVDWGEGMGAAARWLNQRPDTDQLTVAALSVPTFAPIFNGHTLPLDQATLADYLVLAPNQPTNQLTNQPTNHPPTQFLDHATILTNTAPLEQSAYLAAHAEPDDLILLDADTPLLRHHTGPGDLTSIADLPDQTAVAARLVELGAGRPNLWLVADPAASPITAAHLRQALHAIATPVSTVTVASATITQYANPQSPILNYQPLLSTFGDQLTLVDALLPAEPVNTPFSVFLRWQAPAPTPADLHASIQLRDPAGHLWAEVGQPVLNDVTFPTTIWAPGEWADNVLTLRLPQHIPPGDYALQLAVTSAEGAQLGAWDADEVFQGVRVSLGSVEIAPPAQPVLQSLCEERRALTAGPLLACIPDLPPQAIPSGDLLTLAITWSATTPPAGDYHVRWRLLDTAGSIALEQTTDLSPYATSRWRTDDAFESRYDLRLDPTLPAARYTLKLNVLASSGHPVWGEDENVTTVEVLPRDRLFELPSDIAHPLDLALGSAIHLRGFDLTPPPSPLELEGTEGGLRPGDTLSLTLYWQADGPTDIDYTVFAHLVGPDGRPHGQVDRFPGGGAAPTSSWAPGQVILDEITLPVAADAPAGAYHIAVGMYDVVSGGRLPITGGSGNLLPNDQFVLPPEITVTGAPP